MASPKTRKSLNRDKKTHYKSIVVWANLSEYKKLIEKAENFRLPASTYLRNVGLDFPIKNVIDHASVLELIKLKAEINRLSDLLKIWLAEKRGEGSSAGDINRVLNDIRDINQEILQIIKRI